MLPKTIEFSWEKCREYFEVIDNLDESVTLRNVLVASAALSATWLAYKLIKFHLKKRKYRHIPGPPTKGILGYFAGNMPELSEMVNNGKVLPDAHVKWHEKYGEVYKFQMFHRMIVFTSDKNAIREILIEKNYPKDSALSDRVGAPMGERFLGAGLLTEIDHKEWMHRRAIFNTGFHRNVLMSFVSHFNNIVNAVSAKLRSQADGKTPVNLLNEMNRATLDAIAMIAFGMDTNSIDNPDCVFNVYLSKILATSLKSFLNPLFKYQPRNYSEVRQYRNMIRHIRETGRKEILARINAFKSNHSSSDSSSSTTVHNDILQSILSNYKGNDFDLDKMTDDFMTFFVAGQETTANTLASCFLELGRNPEMVKKAREEIDQVLGEGVDMSYEDFKKLRYCTALFKETLRLYPPAPVLVRTITEEMNIQGYYIPKNTTVLMSTYVNSRSPRYFKDPLEFRPERFLKTDENPDSGMESYAYMPFSLGARNCIGRNFAHLEGVMIIAKLLQRFDFRLDPTQSFNLTQTLTLFPKDGTRCFITLRE